jgi:hypothetical protein
LAAKCPALTKATTLAATIAVWVTPGHRKFIGHKGLR